MFHILSCYGILNIFLVSQIFIWVSRCVVPYPQWLCHSKWLMSNDVYRCPKHLVKVCNISNVYHKVTLYTCQPGFGLQIRYHKGIRPRTFSKITQTSHMLRCLTSMCVLASRCYSAQCQCIIIKWVSKSHRLPLLFLQPHCTLI